jgi:hypothetical protein
MSAPAFHRIRVAVEAPVLTDVRDATRSELDGSGVRLEAGSEVAIAVGSRGIAGLVEVVAEVATWAREQGATPFLVPAMGSHGGATGPGQAEVLRSYGLDDPRIGCEIRATMDVVELERGDSPVPVVLDAHAAAAAATIVVNRVKQHTDFHGPHESGLLKMTAIGLGKRVQAEALHAFGVHGLRDVMPVVARQVLRAGNVVLGVGIVENARDAAMCVRAFPVERIEEGELELLDVARRHAPRLPVDRLDVLLVDRMGKDISGVGMDTNVIGRLLIAGEAEPDRPSVAMIGVHALTPASHGNACGVGLADVVTAELADAIDHEVTRTNIVTSGFLLRGKLPVVAPDARTLWAWCLRGAGIVDLGGVRAARIVDTLRCDELWVTALVLADLAGRSDVTVVERDLTLHDDGGALTPFG